MGKTQDRDNYASRLRQTRERAIAMDWATEANKFVDELEVAYQADRKAFIGTRENMGQGLIQAKGAVEHLKALKARLDKYIVTP